MYNGSFSNKKRKRSIEEEAKTNNIENKLIKNNYPSQNNSNNTIENYSNNENNFEDPDLITEEDFLKIPELDFDSKIPEFDSDYKIAEFDSDYFPSLSISKDTNNNKIIEPKNIHSIKNILCLDKSRILICYDKKSPNTFLYKYDLILSHFQPLYPINLHPSPINYIYEKINGELFSLSDSCVCIFNAFPEEYKEIFTYKLEKKENNIDIDSFKNFLCLRNDNFVTLDFKNNIIYWQKNIKEEKYFPININNIADKNDIIISFGEIMENIIVISYYILNKNNSRDSILNFYQIKESEFVHFRRVKSAAQFSDKKNSIITIVGHFFVLLEDGGFLVFNSFSKAYLNKIYPENSSKILLLEARLISNYRIILATLEKTKNGNFLKKYLLNDKMIEKLDENLFSEKNEKCEKLNDMELFNNIENIVIFPVNYNQDCTEYLLPVTKDKKILLYN